MKIRPTKGLTFDDVLLIPRRSSITSRQDVDTSTRLTEDIRIKIPIMSANMDTVTEARMAIAMARAGGIGILHRFMTIEQQVREAKTVKRAQGFIIEHPYNVGPDATIEQARALMDRYKVGALIVVDETGKLIGLVSQRDLMLAPASMESIRLAMTPRERLITVKPDVTVEQARELLYKHRIEKLPVLDKDDNLVGLITSRDLIKLDQSPNVTTDGKGRLRVGAAIGVTTAANVSAPRHYWMLAQMCWCWISRTVTRTTASIWSNPCALNSPACRSSRETWLRARARVNCPKRARTPSRSASAQAPSAPRAS